MKKHSTEETMDRIKFTTAPSFKNLIKDLDLKKETTPVKSKNKIKTYVLLVAKYFPAYHKRAGEPTGFMNLIWKDEKLHTIRKNYELWKKRSEEINNANAILSVRQWIDKPYRSPQKEEFRQYELRVQKLEQSILGWCIDDIVTDYTRKDFAKNDGLSLQDYNNWFNILSEEPLAILHFTQNFKY